MRITRIAACAALAMSCLHAYARPMAVEAVQYPAWLGRDGVEVPLTPGTTIAAGDQIRSGANARVRLRFAEGSAVKLGENARLVIDRVEPQGTFRATLRVLMGAFRFATDPVAPKRAREIALQAKNVSVGVRGTDLWGKSTDDRDFVVLIEGRIHVSSPGNPEITLERPLDLYDQRAGAAPSVTRADPAQVQAFAMETELSPDGAAASGTGGWRTVAAEGLASRAATALARTLRQAGFPAEIVMTRGRVDVHVAGLDSEAAAQAVAARISGLPGVGEPAVRAP